MAHTGSRNTDSTDDTADQSTSGVEKTLAEVSQALSVAECEHLAELGIYSIHEHASARTITLPEDAEGFDDVTAIKQYYYEGGQRPFLIVAPLQV